MKIGLLLIATGKYTSFVQQLLDSANAHFFTGFDVTAYLFTDDMEKEYASDRIKVQKLEISHKPFPYATLLRYHHFVRYAEMIEADYLFYSDVDMRFVAPVGAEVLPYEQGLTAIRHPGFYRGGWGSPNTDRRSRAWLPESKRKNYFCGGFNGGTRDAFLLMSAELADNIQADEDAGVMAEYHDETHLNHYLSSRDPHILNPSYCFPENWKLPYVPKLLALDKNHSEMRS